MKKKVLLISVMAFVLACVFAFSISAENPVFEYDTNRTAVLSDGTPVNLYDESGKALSYYYNGNGELVSDLTVNLFKWNVSGWLEMKDTAICSAANVVIANWQDPELEKTAFSNYGLNISFRHSTSLQQVYFSNIMQKMNGEYVFSNCDSMTIFEFTDESLFFGFGRYTFYDSDALLELNIPKNVTCFSDAENGSYGLATKCDSLHTVTFVSNENMQKINAGAFRECPKLVNITIPDSVTYVGNEVFRSSGIVNSPFTVNSKCTSFGKFICRDCDSLKSFIIPGSLQSFAQDSGYGPLAECAGEELVVSWGTYADPQNGITKEVISYFFGQAAIKSVIIPEHITTIKANAFKNCGGVELIKVPNSVTIIEERAFEKCEQLKTLILGDGLTHFVNTTTDHGSLTYGTPVTTIYLPASFYSEAPETAYRVSYMFQCNGNANVKIFYTGSKEKLNNAIKNFVDGTTNSNDNNAAFISGEQVSYAAYLLNPEKYEEGRYVIYDYNVCEAFYDNSHEESDKIVFGENRYFENASICTSCSRCNSQTGEKILTPLFKSMGYSYSTNAIMQGFAVNYEMLAEYQAYYKDNEISFGLIAASVNVAGDGDLLGAAKKAQVDFTTKGYDVFEMKITGIEGENKAVGIYICGYIVIGDETYYLNEGKCNVNASDFATSYEQVASNA